MELAMEIVIQPDADAAAKWVARLIATELRAQPHLVLGLATGSTMDSVYASLAKLHARKGRDFSHCLTINLAEYVDLDADDPNSYRTFMEEQLFHQVNINPRNTHIPDGTARPISEECDNYEGRISEVGGIDLQLLGIGNNGHIGFNEPLSSFRSRTRVVALTAATRRQNAPLFPRPALVPKRAITVGLGTIMDARRCILLATGADKADIVAQALGGPVSRKVPASILQRHPDCTAVLDAAAAKKLEEIRGT
jgi:glucosamine-6-phosphate deaminase